MLTTTDRRRTVLSGYLHDQPEAGHANDAIILGKQSFAGVVEPLRLGYIPASTISDPQATTVRPHLSARSRLTDGYLLGLVMSGSGSLWSQPGSMELEPGALTLYRASDPFLIRFDGAHRYFVAEVPGALLCPGGMAIDFAMASRELSSTPAARMAASMLSTMPEVAVHASAELRRQLGETVVALVRAAIDEVGGVRRPSTPEGVLDVILDWIDTHLDDPMLTPGMIADANHVSLRYLHKLFQLRGTSVGETVRRRRIDRVKTDLASPGLDGWTVAAIGTRWGIPDATQLTRQFRMLEQVTPGQWRRDRQSERERPVT